MPFVKLLAALVGLACLGLFVICYFEVGSELSSGINQQGLAELRPGMKGEDVISLIGPPLEKKEDFNDEIGHPQSYARWIYGKPGLCQGGLEITVGFKNGRLDAVGVELYDLGVYRCNQEKCPVVWDEEALKRLPARKPEPSSAPTTTTSESSRKKVNGEIPRSLPNRGFLLLDAVVYIHCKN